jgi:hypothetical protein
VNASPTYTLATNNYVDVIVYDRALSGGAIDSNACSSESASVTVNVSALPDPSLTATNITGNTYCPGQSVDFAISLTASDPTATFEYTTGGAWSAPSAVPTFTLVLSNNNVNASDHVTVTLRVTSGNCSSVVIETLYLQENEITDVGTVSATDLTVCSGQIPGNIESTSLATTTISGTTIGYQWYQRVSGLTTWTLIPAPRGVSSTLNFSGSPLTVSTDFIRVITASANGQSCTESSTSPVTISIASGPTAVFQAPDLSVVSPGMTYNMCQGTNQVFRASGGLSYEFRINGVVEYTVGASSTSDQVTFDPLVN